MDEEGQRGLYFFGKYTHTHSKVMAKWLKETVDLHKTVGTEAQRKNNEGSRAKFPVGNWSIKEPGIQSREWLRGWRESRDGNLNPSALFLTAKRQRRCGPAFSSGRGPHLKHSGQGPAGHPDAKRLKQRPEKRHENLQEPSLRRSPLSARALGWLRRGGKWSIAVPDRYQGS